jgi:hypothetical protein
MLPELTPHEFSAALDAVAAEMLAERPDSQAPIDALELARALGLAVAWDERQSSRGRTARLSSRGRGGMQASILVRPEPRPERLQWTIAHEIGELVAHRVFARLGVDPREAPAAARETVANAIAPRILLPREAFEAAGRETAWELVELKLRFPSASHELIARRMLDFGDNVIITVFDHGRRTFRRGNLPFRLPPLCELEEQAWSAAHHQAAAALVTDFVRRVQAWPVHEPDWKREILRTELLGEDAA